MNFSPRISARPLSVVSALLLVVLSLGVNGSAFAAPIMGNGNGQSSNSANGNGNGPGANNGNQQSTATSTPSTNASTAQAKSSSSSDAKSNSSSSAKSDKSHSSSNAKSSTASSHKDTGTAATVGDVKQPQPISNADKNSGGANGQCLGGAYCSTRDGSPSLNGNGNGQATGKPCAGCVGKADNKNPKGQMPNGSDHNNGYECDGNNGIGKTNPAHTGCKGYTPPACVPSTSNNQCGNPPACVPSTANNCGNPPACVPSTANNCGNPPACVPSTANNCANPPPACEPAVGQDENCNAIPPKVNPGQAHRPPKVLGTEVFAPAHQPKAQVLGTQAVRPAGALPNTGAGDGMGLLAMSGLGLLLMGGATLLLRRRSVRS
jgi:LPXTG-motif cell wall-anchored protein